MFPSELSKCCKQLADEGVQSLDMPIGIVSHIYNGIYQIVAINSAVDALVSGAIFPLKNTYSRDVFRSGKTIATTEIEGSKGLKRHPLYVSLPLKAYIGAPIHFNNTIWGTVNFTSTHPHKAFTPAEIELVESYATKISRLLEEIDTATRTPWDNSIPHNQNEPAHEVA